MGFKEVNPKEWTGQPSQLFGEEWAALCAGTKETGYNAMTIAWGNIGTLWEKETHANRLPTATVYVRPSRYTHELMERETYFAIASFGKDGKKTLGYLGSKSGRDEDKFAGANLTPVFDGSVVYPDEAASVIVCKKLYAAPIKEEYFVENGLVPFNYPKEDFHTMYIGQIMRIYVKE